jgi:hypothetical protein
MPPRLLGPYAPLLSTAYGSLPYQFGGCCACLTPRRYGGHWLYAVPRLVCRVWNAWRLSCTRYEGHVFWTPIL